MRSRYADMISTTERAAAMKLGMKTAATRYCLRHGYAGLQKQAVGPAVLGVLGLTGHGLAATLKTVAGLSVLTGIPAGLLMHEIGRQATQHSAKEDQSLETIRGYHSAGRDVSRMPEYKSK